MNDAMRDESRLLAEELYAVLQALAPGPSGGDPHQVEARLRTLGSRLRTLQAADPSSDATGATVALQRHLGALELLLRDPAPDAAAAPATRWRTFRRRLSPAYQAFAAFLREQRIVVPSLRPSNVPRIVFHVASGAVAFALIQVLEPFALRLTAGAFATSALVLESTRRRWPAWNEVLMRLFAPVAHPHEYHRMNSATWYALALAILSVLAPPTIASLAVGVLAIADPVAGLVGRRFGRTPLRAGRSLEGSLAFLASGTLVAAAVLVGWFPGLGWPAVAALSVTAGASGALAELWTRHFDDNFMIPLAVAAATSLVSAVLPAV